MDNRGKTMVDDQFNFGFAVDWMRKDLGLVLDEARRNGARLPVTALVDQFYADVQTQGGGRWDTSSLIVVAGDIDVAALAKHAADLRAGLELDGLVLDLRARRAAVAVHQGARQGCAAHQQGSAGRQGQGGGQASGDKGGASVQHGVRVPVCAGVQTGSSESPSSWMSMASHSACKASR
jgi:hypothetical protein